MSNLQKIKQCGGFEVFKRIGRLRAGKKRYLVVIDINRYCCNNMRQVDKLLQSVTAGLKKSAAVAAAVMVFSVPAQAMPVPERPISGVASWYDSESACGSQTNRDPLCRTASGHSIYDLQRGKEFFIAMNGVPLGSRVRVTANGRSIYPLVLDRGGFEKYGRVADISKAGFERLAGSNRHGLINVKIEIIP